MNKVVTISMICGLFLTGMQAGADDKRCKVNSSGTVEAINSTELNDIFCGLVDTIVQEKKKNDAQALTEAVNDQFDSNYKLIVITLLLNRNTDSSATNKLKGSFLSLVEESRVDKQVGAGASSSGTTTLTSKGNVPEILGLAVENGALTQSQSGTTVTFTGNPVGIIKALAGASYIEGYADDDSMTRHIRDFSFSVSFDTSRGNNNGTFTGDAQQVSAYSFRYALLNHRDPRSIIYNSNWLALAQGAGRSSTKDGQRVFLALRKNDAFVKWLQSAKEAVNNVLSGATDQDVESKVEQTISDQLFVELKKKQDQFDDVVPLVNAYSQSEAKFLTDRKAILDLATKGSIVTLEYVNNRQLKAPDISNFKLIAEGNAGNKVDLTANVSFDILNQVPTVEPKANRLQDFKVSGEADFRAGDVAHLGSVVLTLSGMYQRLLNDTITSAGVVTPNTKGDFAVGQFKITIPVKGSGVKIPFSFSVANRTDLIKETDVRGSFGLTFDLDSLFAKANP